MFSNSEVATNGNEVEMIVLSKDHHGCFPLVENDDGELLLPNVVVGELWTGLLILLHLLLYILKRKIWENKIPQISQFIVGKYPIFRNSAVS